MMLSNQTRRMVRSGLVALVSLAALTSPVLAATSTLDVSGPFSGIQSCVSADILVVPGDDYNVQVTGDDKAVAATSASVDSGILQFAVKGPLSTNEAFYITVTMPSDASSASSICAFLMSVVSVGMTFAG